MRLLSLFFAFYFACLSCLTCADEAGAGTDAGQTTVASASHTDCHADAIGDWCSPLCQCQCCGGALVPLAPLPVLAPALSSDWAAVRHARLIVGASSQALGAVWQPPQA